MASAQHTIVNGPPKFDLMVSLFEGNPTPRKTVSFLTDRGSINVAITAIAQEDGSGESWLFEGYSTTRSSHRRVKGWFSTKSRAGTMDFL